MIACCESDMSLCKSTFSAYPYYKSLRVGSSEKVPDSGFWIAYLGSPLAIQEVTTVRSPFLACRRNWRQIGPSSRLTDRASVSPGLEV